MTTATVLLSVPDISCEHCERAISNALVPLAGVTAVRVDIPAKLVRVDYDARLLDVDRMKEVLQEEEYPVASAVPA